MAVEDPRARWNRLIGNRIGRTKTVDQPPQVNFQRTRGARTRHIARGAPSIPAATTRAFRNISGQGGGAGRTRRVGSTDVWESVYDELTEDFLETQAERQALQRINEQPGEDVPWYQDVGNFLFGTGDRGFADSAIGRGLDVLSRPFYAATGAVNELLESEQPGQSAFSPSNIVQNLASGEFWNEGIWEGLSGEDKSGWGTTWETMKENLASPAGAALRNFEREHPALEQFASQAYGLAGEVFLDPLNVAAPSVPNMLRKGEVATQATLTNANLRAVEESVNDFVAGSGLIQNSAVYARNPGLLTDRLRTHTMDFIEQAILDVSSGGGRGTRLLNNRYWPQMVAARTSQEIKNAMTQPFINDVHSVVNRARMPKGLDESTVRAMIQHDTQFEEFWTKLENLLVSENRIPSGAGIDEIIVAIRNGAVSDRHIERIINDVISKYDPELETVYNNIIGRTRNQTYRSVGIRVADRQVPLFPVGRAYQFFGSKLDNVFPNRTEAMSRTFFESRFPGIFGLKTGRARALAFNAMDEYRKRIMDFARKFSKDEARELMMKLESGGRFGDSRMDDALDFLREEYRKIFETEQGAGARPISGMGSTYDPNYVFVYNKGGIQGKRTEYKTGRKEAINSDKVKSSGEWTLGRAKRDGLRPEENAFKSLFYRYAKSRRDLAKAFFMEDLLDSYAVGEGFKRGTRRGTKPVRKLSPKDAQRRGLVHVPISRLPAPYRQMLIDNPGSAYYLPKALFDPNKATPGLFQTFEDIQSWTPADQGQILRNFAKVINVIKAGLTLPYLGFHVRNMIGDVFMGILDGIRPNAYHRVMQGWLADQAGKTYTFKIIPGKFERSFKEMLDMYHRNADAGFFDVEFGSYESMTAGNLPRRLPRRILSKGRRLADKRELFPRFVHFTEAFRQEADALWRKGMRDLVEIERRASNAALWRVNQYKFDYSALLPFEKQAKTLAFPFYTYLRKAIPLLLQQMFTNPHWFSTINRFMTYNDGSSADEFDDTLIPDWIRDLGFALLTDEEEPWRITADILPLGALDIIAKTPIPGTSGSTADFTNEILANLNPPLQALIETGTGQQIFERRPMDQSTGEYLLDQLPLIGSVQEEVFGENAPGGEDWLQNLLNNRLTGLGLPVQQITEEQQAYQHNANVDQAIEAPIQEFNYSQDRYRISTTDELYFRVRDTQSGETLGEFLTPDAAIAFARKLPGADYQRPFVSTRQPPSFADLEQVLSGS